ncbi:MAG: T9SS type A sorting domain-containing protein [Ignavibacteriae bacterium]|nr:T9SS type A sorting domain-containing protein [Ignavibacteriota bacterium]
MKKKYIYLFIIQSFLINNVFAQMWKSYTSENSGLSNNQVNAIAVSGDGTIWFATDDGLCAFDSVQWKVYKINDGLKSNMINTISFLPHSSQELFVSSDSGITILTVDKTDITSIPKYINKSVNNIISNKVSAVEIDGKNNNWIGTADGLSIITNSGIYNFDERNGFENPKVNTLKTLPDDWVYIGTSGGGVNRLKYKGVDGISSASNIITTWSGLASDTVLTIYVTDDTLRWYGTTQGVSTHFGTDTKDINYWWIYNTYTSGIAENYVRAIVRDKNRAMWFGTRKGISKMSADKSTWQTYTETDGLISNNIFDISVDKNNNLWIATDKGVSFFNNVILSTKKLIPRIVELSMTNFPNPFNPSTIIEYTIPRTSKVRLEVYDNLGKLIEVLVDKKLNPGNYRTQFKINGITSGIYFYRLITDKSVITKKMILLK